MNNQYIFKFKQAIEHNLKIAKWNPSDSQLYSIATDISNRNCEPSKNELLRIIEKYYHGSIIAFSKEGVDNSDRIFLLNWAIRVKNNANE